MDNKNIIFNHTFEQYNKKYKNLKHNLLKLTRKHVEDFDKQYGHYTFDTKTYTLNFDHYLLKDRKWWYIKETDAYYETPKPVRYTWFRNLNAGVQAVTCLLGVGIIAGGVGLGIYYGTKQGSQPVIPEKIDFNLNYGDTTIGFGKQKTFFANLKNNKDKVKNIEWSADCDDVELTPSEDKTHCVVKSKTNVAKKVKLKVIVTSKDNAVSEKSSIISIKPIYDIDLNRSVVIGDARINNIYLLMTLATKIVFGTYDEYGQEMEEAISIHSRVETDVTQNTTGKVFAYCASNIRDLSNRYVYFLTKEDAVIQIDKNDCNHKDSHGGNIEGLFYAITSAKEIVLNDVFFASDVDNLKYMFYQCDQVEKLNISNICTDNIEDYTAMFGSCTSLKTLDLSNFNTSKATNFTELFSSCGSLEQIDVSNFDTSNVTSFESMFNGIGVKTLDVSNFDMSKANPSTGSSSFIGDGNLEELKLPNSIKYLNSNFLSSRSIETIHLPESIISISNSAFNDTMKLKNLIIDSQAVADMINDTAYIYARATTVKVNKKIKLNDGCFILTKFNVKGTEGDYSIYTR